MAVSDHVQDDAFAARKPSPWPLALRAVVAVLVITMIAFFAFPDG